MRELPPLLALLERSWGNSTMLQRSGALVAAAEGADDATAALFAPSAAPLRNFAKDLDFVLEASDDGGRHTRVCLEQAVGRGRSQRPFPS